MFFKINKNINIKKFIKIYINLVYKISKQLENLKSIYISRKNTGNRFYFFIVLLLLTLKIKIKRSLRSFYILLLFTKYTTLIKEGKYFNYKKYSYII